jgi:hypothetical protein
MSLNLDQPVRRLYIQPFYFSDEYMRRRFAVAAQRRLVLVMPRSAPPVSEDELRLDVPEFLRGGDGAGREGKL